MIEAAIAILYIIFGAIAMLWIRESFDEALEHEYEDD